MLFKSWTLSQCEIDLLNCARDEIISEIDGDVNANFEDAGLVLDKNVPVCSIQNVPEKWGCIDHLTYMYFFFST